MGEKIKLADSLIESKNFIKENDHPYSAYSKNKASLKTWSTSWAAMSQKSIKSWKSEARKAIHELD